MMYYIGLYTKHYIFGILCLHSFRCSALSTGWIQLSTRNNHNIVSSSVALMMTASHDPPSMLVVAEEPMISLGASLAFSVADLLEKKDGLLYNQPPRVALLQSSSSLTTSPQQETDVLHVVIQSKDDALNLLQSKEMINASCLGVQLDVSTGTQMVPPETAHTVGNLIQEIFNSYETTPIAISLDLPLHLALLRENSLPKTSRHNCFQVICPEESICVEYKYDWNNPFGGSDPLACGSSEYRFFNSSAGDAKGILAGAYTALIGYGLDTVSSAGIAASVGAVLASNPSMPDYSLETAQAILDHYQTKLLVTEDNGVLRQKYIEFGYK